MSELQKSLIVKGNLSDRIEQAVRNYPQWSNAERRRIDSIVDEVLEHVRNGSGNTFIREWCNRNLPFLKQS